MGKCPYCDYETPPSDDLRATAQAEISHMNENHRDVIRKRLEDIGIHPDDVKDYPFEDEETPGTLIYDLTRAERHLSYVLKNLYGPARYKRGFFYRRGLLQAQNAVMIRLKKELSKESKRGFDE